METRDIISFNVKEQSAQEFADKWFVKSPIKNGDRPEQANPYYLLGQQSLFVKKDIMSVIENDPVIIFELFDESRLARTLLVNTYTYAIEKYDNVSLRLDLIDFKVEVRK